MIGGPSFPVLHALTNPEHSYKTTAEKLPKVPLIMPGDSHTILNAIRRIVGIGTPSAKLIELSIILSISATVGVVQLPTFVGMSVNWEYIPGAINDKNKNRGTNIILLVFGARLSNTHALYNSYGGNARSRINWACAHIYCA